MKVLRLESERLILEPLTLRHLSEKYVSWMNDIDVYKYLETGGNYTQEDLDLYLRDQEEKKIFFWGNSFEGIKKNISEI